MSLHFRTSRASTASKGEIFHSSRWNHDADLTGKRVAVIGNRRLGHPDRAGHRQEGSRISTLYQRTAPWILPRADREYTKIEHLAFKYLPGFQKLCRTGIYWMRETQVVGLAKAPVFMKPLQFAAERHLKAQIKDQGSS